MKRQRLIWNDLGITTKFSLAFSLLFLLILLITGTGFVAFRHIHQAEIKIHTSMEIGQLVLQMERGLERAKRLHADFLIHYPYLGLQKAHEQYAQPAIREIAEVIRISTPLKDLLYAQTPDQEVTINRADLNLYLSSANRFAATSIEAVELITRKVAPERGLETRLNNVYLELDKALKKHPDLRSMHKEAVSYFKDYLLSRQHYLMQSSTNALEEIQAALRYAPPGRSDSERLYKLFVEQKKLSNELLEVDQHLEGKIRDFALQEETVRPLSHKLTEYVEHEIAASQTLIEQLKIITSVVMLAATMISALILFFIAKLTHTTITRKILQLAGAAQEFARGDLDTQVHISSADEIGQLSKIFNAMALRLKGLINNLEQEVEKRTSDLVASEQRFRHLVNDLPKLAVRGLDETRTIIYWNKACELFYGYSADEILGKKVEKILYPEGVKNHRIAQINKWFEHGIIFPSSELELLHKNGNTVPVYSSPVMQVNNDKSRTIYCIDLDLAELKLAQETSRQSEAFFRQIFEHSTSGIMLCEALDNGMNFRIREMNQAAMDINNLSWNKLDGMTLLDLYPFAEDIGLLPLIRKVWETGTPRQHPACHYHGRQTDSWRETRVYRLPNGEIVLIVNDLTQQKKAENEKSAMEKQLQRAQKMEAIGLMAGGVAHDLNNILTSLTGYPELILLKLPKDSELREPILALKEAGERSAAVVADLLTIARGVAKVQEVHNLNELINEYLRSPEFIKLKSNSPHIRFTFSYEDQLPPILCSPVHVKKCIMNLVSNAAEAIEEPGTIYISTHKVIPEGDRAFRYGLEPGPHAVLRVVDTGKGIAAQDMENIFEPFYSKKAMGTKSGSGLGLSVVWNTMKDHQGAAIASNTSDKGACFELYFPGTNKSAPSRPPAVQDVQIGSGEGERILVVDDERQPRDIATRMLIHLGYEVDAVDSGEQALEWLDENTADLVVIDMIMGPGISGEETFSRIRRRNPDQKAILISGFSESDAVKKALAGGARGFLKKPYNLARLGQAVRDALDE